MTAFAAPVCVVDNTPSGTVASWYPKASDALPAVTAHRDGISVGPATLRTTDDLDAFLRGITRALNVSDLLKASVDVSGYATHKRVDQRLIPLNEEDINA